jgi:hypothetical protein
LPFWLMKKTHSFGALRDMRLEHGYLWKPREARGTSKPIETYRNHRSATLRWAKGSTNDNL